MLYNTIFRAIFTLYAAAGLSVTVSAIPQPQDGCQITGINCDIFHDREASQIGDPEGHL